MILAAGLVLSLGLAGCRSAPEADAGAVRTDPYARSEVAARSLGAESSEAAVRRAAARDLGRMGGDAAADILVGMLSDPDADVAAEAAFALAISGGHNAAGRLVANLPADAGPEQLDAAAMGLGGGPGDAFESALVALARDHGRPAAVPGALLNHYRWRGRPAPATLPDEALLGYATAEDVGARAGFGHMCRAIKDPRVVEPLLALAKDPDPRVRRAAVMGSARSARTPWPDAEAGRIVAALEDLRSDPDARVVVAVCRALGSYEGSGAKLVPVLDHEDFNARSAAIETLVRLEYGDAVDRIATLAAGDPSVFVRGTAITALSKLAPADAYELASAALEDDAEFVRASACDALAVAPEAQGDSATARLAVLVFDDPHVRVRHSALDKLKGREGAIVDATVERVLREEQDPVVVAVGCDVAATNEMSELLPLVRAVPARFTGRDGADARQGAIGALGTFGDPVDEPLIRSFFDDPNPSVAMAAEQALAARAGVANPAPRRAGVRGAERGDLVFFTGTGSVLMIVDTSRGTMTFELDHRAAPLHVAHVAAFAGRGGYDGLSWHRVVPDFVIQGGCPRGDGSGGAGVSLPLEPTRIPFERGALGMPRSAHLDSGGCQLFVMHSRAPHLDVHYTAFGRLIDGDEVIDRIDVDDRILSVKIRIPTEPRPR